MHEMNFSDAAPLIIGATGGSGTRVIARIARHAGYELGTHLNSAEDALDFLDFHDRWINRLVRAGSLPADATARLERDFREVLARHRAGFESAPRWGWKAPRSIYFVPFFRAQFPRMRFIHVLRDGRDMAFSKNQNQLRKHGAALLNWRERWLPLPIRSLLVWERVNLRAAAFCEAQMRDRYLVVRFEDLCAEPAATAERLLHFLEAPTDGAADAAGEVVPPKSLGRWRTQPTALTPRFQNTATGALRKFGYLALAP